MYDDSTIFGPFCFVNAKFFFLSKSLNFDLIDFILFFDKLNTFFKFFLSLFIEFKSFLEIS